jgi:hypothetical protein
MNLGIDFLGVGIRIVGCSIPMLVVLRSISAVMVVVLCVLHVWGVVSGWSRYAVRVVVI